MKRPARRPHGYTLIEVLTAAVILGVSLSAAVSMSTTMMMQEELSLRVTQSLNYQENAARLWQLGLNPFQVAALMPGTNGNPVLTRALVTTGNTNALGAADADGIGALESATHTIQVNNFDSSPGTGAVSTVTVYRPTIR